MVKDEQERNALFFGLYTRGQPRLYSFLQMMVHNSADAEELMQETALVMWEQFDKFEEGTNFTAWAITIARLKAFEYLRKNRKAMLFHHDIYEKISAQAEITSSETESHIAALKYCLRKLDKTNRSLLEMRFKRNLTVADMSQITEKSINVLYKTLSRLVSSLRICISKAITREGLI